MAGRPGLPDSSGHAIDHVRGHHAHGVRVAGRTVCSANSRHGHQVVRFVCEPCGYAIRPARAANRLGPWSPWGRAVRLHREFSSLLFEEMSRRRATGIETRDDVLSMLLQARDESGAPLDDEALRDEMLTLLLAGHETTAASLSWVIYRLLANPEVAERARQETVEVTGTGPVRPEHVGRLRYLDAVLKETMRLDPVIPNAGRALQADVTLSGRELPAGVVVAPCIYLAHRRADSWPEPLRFNPERFMGGRADPYAFFPFGGGTRRCIGAAFAIYQMKIVLAEILSRVEFKPVEGYVARLERRSITFAPSQGLPVVVTRRLHRERIPPKIAPHPLLD